METETIPETHKINKTPKRQNRGSEYFLTIEEIRKVADAAKNNRDHTIINLLASTGMRREEVTYLKVENIDFDRNQIHLTHTKGSKERVIPAPQSVLREIRYLIKNRSSGYVFLNPEGNRLTPRMINYIVGNCGKRAEVSNPDPNQERINPHIFRHTFARTFLKTNPAAFRELQNLLGHSTIKTTLDTYSTPSMKDTENAARNYWQETGFEMKEKNELK